MRCGQSRGEKTGQVDDLEAGDLCVAEVLLPVEAGGAVVGHHLAGVLGADGLRKLPGLLQVGGGGLHPQQVGIGCVGQATCDGGLQLIAEVGHCFFRSFPYWISMWMMAKGASGMQNSCRNLFGISGHLLLETTAHVPKSMDAAQKRDRGMP